MLNTPIEGSSAATELERSLGSLANLVRVSDLMRVHRLINDSLSMRQHLLPLLKLRGVLLNASIWGIDDPLLEGNLGVLDNLGAPPGRPAAPRRAGSHACSPASRMSAELAPPRIAPALREWGPQQSRTAESAAPWGTQGAQRTACWGHSTALRATG